MSHNTMATFLSGTDTSTLREEGSYKNNFVSLIVNNEGTYTAAITRHVFCEVENSTTYTYEMFGDGPKTGNEKGLEKKECIEYFMMDVNKPPMPENPLDSRIDEILEKKRKPASKYNAWSSDSSVIYNDRTSYDAYKDIPFYAGDLKDKSDDSPGQIGIPWDEKEFNTKPNSTTYSINRHALRVTMAKLLTSSVTCNPYQIDIDSWISNYDKVYATKFEDLVDFSEWLAPYLEYLMYHIPGAPTDIVDDALVAVYANEIISKIGKPKGKYSAELVDQLKFYGTD